MTYNCLQIVAHSVSPQSFNELGAWLLLTITMAAAFCRHIIVICDLPCQFLTNIINREGRRLQVSPGSIAVLPIHLPALCLQHLHILHSSCPQCPPAHSYQLLVWNSCLFPYCGHLRSSVNKLCSLKVIPGDKALEKIRRIRIILINSGKL